MQKIVNFDEWCHKCEHFNVVDWDDPCNDCLNNPGNEDSHRPVYFKEDTSKTHGTPRTSDRSLRKDT